MLGNISKESSTKEWSELSDKSGIKICTRECKKESVVIMRSEMMVKCKPESACTICLDTEQFAKMIREVESVTKISSAKNMCVCLVKCKKLATTDTPIESLTVCGCKKIGDS